MTKVLSTTAAILKMIAGVFIGLMTLMVGLLIVGRYANWSVPWADELARLFFIWGALLGAAAACRNKLHFSVTFFTSLLPDRARAHLKRIVAVMMVGIMCAVLAALYEGLSIASIHMLPGLGISKVWFQIPLAVSAILMIVFLLEQIIKGFSTPPNP